MKPRISWSTTESITSAMRPLTRRNLGWESTRKTPKQIFRNKIKPSNTAAWLVEKLPQIARYASVPNGTATKSPIINISVPNAASPAIRQANSHKSEITRVIRP